MSEVERQVGPAFLEPGLNLGHCRPFEYRGHKNAPTIHLGLGQVPRNEAEYIDAIRHVYRQTTQHPFGDRPI